MPNNNLVVPFASKKVPNTNPTLPVFSTPPKQKRSEVLLTSELELVQTIGMERSNLSKKLESLFNGNSADIVPCLLKPHVNIPYHNYDRNLNYKDMCNFLKISIHKH